MVHIPLSFNNRVSVYSIDTDGIRSLVNRSNIVTLTGKVRAAEILGGLSIAVISKCQLGDGGTNGVALNTPVAPLEANTALVNPLQEVAIATKVVINNNVLKLTSNFFTASANINPFLTANEVASEAGLLFQDSVLFARTTFPSIPFNVASRVGISVVWEVEIT